MQSFFPLAHLTSQADDNMARCHSECGCRNTWTRKRNVNDITVARRQMMYMTPMALAQLAHAACLFLFLETSLAPFCRIKAEQTMKSHALACASAGNMGRTASPN